MTKPSEELLRRARELRRKYSSDFGTFPAKQVDALLFEFAEQIVRGCSEIAKEHRAECVLTRSGVSCDKCKTAQDIESAILRKFGLKE